VRAPVLLDFEHVVDNSVELRGGEWSACRHLTSELEEHRTAQPIAHEVPAFAMARLGRAEHGKRAPSMMSSGPSEYLPAHVPFAQPAGTLLRSTRIYAAALARIDGMHDDSLSRDRRSRW
jgi:hypothetical protein